ncbi:hypothetical protein H5P28_05480 [Ruficoccus amylovorans]|uniref:PEP-CTERM protein-sorting domain-containing protein n=1 Tax=Ruficoccus amylovorans TaxID=1804625 RepID=A0A842HC07_9BACT|nr:hypothetical protein [Ruficoccus amylovorans]MBC2593709.1 hypothetical protein [Ruficoccus amylovorans]
MHKIYSLVTLLLTATASAFAATTLPVNDDFDNGNTLGWVSGQSGNVTFDDSAMQVGVNNTGFHSALQFDAVTLADGQTLNAAFTFSTPSSSTWSTTNAMRIALLNTDTTLPNNSNPNITATGFMFGLNNLNGTDKANSGAYLFYRNTNSGPITNSQSPYTVISGTNNAFSGGLAASTTYTYTLTFTNTGSGNITITALLSGGDIDATTQTWNTTTSSYTFNTFAIGATAINPITVESVSLTQIPEASSLGLIFAGLAACLVFGCRIRACR